MFKFKFELSVKQLDLIEVTYKLIADMVWKPKATYQPPGYNPREAEAPAVGSQGSTSPDLTLVPRIEVMYPLRGDQIFSSPSL